MRSRFIVPGVLHCAHRPILQFSETAGLKGASLANTVLISNLPASMDASGLEDMFTSVGNVVRARMAGAGQGYVEMCTPEDMQNCVLHFHGQIKDGKTLAAHEDKPYVPKAPIAASAAKGSRKKRATK